MLHQDLNAVKVVAVVAEEVAGDSMTADAVVEVVSMIEDVEVVAVAVVAVEEAPTEAALEISKARSRPFKVWHSRDRCQLTLLHRDDHRETQC